MSYQVAAGAAPIYTMHIMEKCWTSCVEEHGGDPEKCVEECTEQGDPNGIYHPSRSTAVEDLEARNSVGYVDPCPNQCRWAGVGGSCCEDLCHHHRDGVEKAKTQCRERAVEDFEARNSVGYVDPCPNQCRWAGV